jgi:spermidine/putrescine transport system substrate-binding protein
MKKMHLTSLIRVFAGLALLGLLSACGRRSSENELVIYIWTEYMDPDIITAFEEEFGVTVVFDYYESNEEMMARLQAGGTSQYDLAFPSDYIMPSLVELNLVQPLNHDLIPNKANLSPNFVDPPFDPGNRFTVAYQWGTVGLIFDKDKLGADVDSWGALFENEAGHPFMLFDSEREQIAVALAYLGFSMNTLDLDELQAAADLLIRAKNSPHFRGFAGNVDARNQVVAGNVAMSLAYNGDALRVLEDHDNIGFVNPREGTVLWVDSFVIPSRAPNPELAHEFINFMLRPEIAAQLTNWTMYATPVEPALALVDPELLENPAVFPTPEVRTRLQYIEDLGENNRVISELWQMIKTR